MCFIFVIQLMQLFIIPVLDLVELDVAIFLQGIVSIV